MDEKRLIQIERRIKHIKQALSKIGPLRPGSLTRQYRDPKTKNGAYWQVSYTRNMRSKSEHVRPECVTQIREEISNYKCFKELMNEWIDLGVEASKIRMKISKKTRSR